MPRFHMQNRSPKARAFRVVLSFLVRRPDAPQRTEFLPGEFRSQSDAWAAARAYVATLPEDNDLMSYNPVPIY